ncbi:MAG: CBS domain-containing protein, partial [Magnetococcales bacterium]|nr:CBS domain-containing protein [Magnetococcales bacterium]
MGTSATSLLAQSVILQLQRHAPFHGMTMEHLTFLVDKLQVSYYAKGELIFTPGQGPVDKFCIIRQGVVASDEKQPALNSDFSTVTQLMEGECFPLGALLENRPVTTYFLAVTDCFLFELEVEHFRLLVEKSPPFRDFCSRPLAHLQEISFRNLRSRFLLSGNGAIPMDTTLQQLIKRSPVVCPLESSLNGALDIMQRADVGCVVVVDELHQVQGVFTLKDVLNRVTLPGRSLDTPVREVMTPHPFCLPGSATVQEAALAMTRRGLHRILVVNEGRLVGVVSERDCFSLQHTSLGQLHENIRTATEMATLRELGKEITRLIKNMLIQGVGAEHLTEVIANLNEQLTCRIIHLEHQNTLYRGELSPEVRFTWLAMGSEGRCELTMRGDQ